MLSRPFTRSVPVSHLVATVEHLGALNSESYAAFKGPIGEQVGEVEGDKDGNWLGLADGDVEAEGVPEGDADGALDVEGISEGMELGNDDGRCDGVDEG